MLMLIWMNQWSSNYSTSDYPQDWPKSVSSSTHQTILILGQRQPKRIYVVGSSTKHCDKNLEAIPLLLDKLTRHKEKPSLGIGEEREDKRAPVEPPPSIPMQWTSMQYAKQQLRQKNKNIDKKDNVLNAPFKDISPETVLKGSNDLESTKPLAV